MLPSPLQVRCRSWFWSITSNFSTVYPDAEAMGSHRQVTGEKNTRLGSFCKPPSLFRVAESAQWWPGGEAVGTVAFTPYYLVLRSSDKLVSDPFDNTSNRTFQASNAFPSPGGTTMSGCALRVTMTFPTPTTLQRPSG